MALTGLTPFGQQGVLDADPAGVQGRDIAQWGTPQQDQAQWAGEPAPGAPTPVFAPGAEYGMGGDYGLHTDVVPGAGPIVSVPVTGYKGPADPAWQQWQSDIIAARANDTHDEPWDKHIKNPADGHPSVATRRLQVTDTTDQHAANATITPSLDIWRTAELIVHNVAKTLLVPIIHYSERPFYNNVAITAPQTQQPAGFEQDGTGRYQMSPANTYASTGIGSEYAYDPGIAQAYEQPAEPAVTPDSGLAQTAPAMGESWLNYG